MDVNENLIAGVITARPRIQEPAAECTTCQAVYEDYDVYYPYPSLGSIIGAGIFGFWIVEIMFIAVVAVFSGILFIILKKNKNTYVCPACGKRFKIQGFKPIVCPECGSDLNIPKCP